jgi:hypothetical protein
MLRWMGLILGACLAAAPSLASAAASLDLYYERTVMTLADQRCGLFEPGVRTALSAAQVQARGAALRAGSDRAALQAIEQRARVKVAATSCKSPDMAVAADRVRHAFEGYARMIRMDYPGDQLTWKADRSSSVAAVRWRLTQDITQRGDRMVFGLAGREGANAVMAVARFKTNDTPYTARLIMRDDILTVGPYLDTRGASRTTTPLDRRLAPQGSQASFSAEARSRAGVDLLPKSMSSGWAFRFPPEAARALANLDPREAVAVDFFFPGDQVRRLYVEVGDFAAGRAFLQVATR